MSSWHASQCTSSTLLYHRFYWVLSSTRWERYLPSVLGTGNEIPHSWCCYRPNSDGLRFDSREGTWRSYGHLTGQSCYETNQVRWLSYSASVPWLELRSSHHQSSYLEEKGRQEKWWSSGNPWMSRHLTSSYRREVSRTPCRHVWRHRWASSSWDWAGIGRQDWCWSSRAG